MITQRCDDIASTLAAALTRRPVADDASPGPIGLSVAYQVMIDLRSGRMVGVEALARLHDDRHRSIRPDDFIPVAEQSGMIAALDRHVLRTACADLAGWRTLSPAAAHLGVSVNISAHHADTADLVGDVRRALYLSGLPPAALTVELTETVLVRREHPVVAALHQLRALGVRVALDDFGTGYAALSHLLRLPVTDLKIDKLFTAGLPADPVSTTIVGVLLGLARELGLRCVVEGIETETQRETLVHGLPPGAAPSPRTPAGTADSLIGQGYPWGRPIPARDIADLVVAATSDSRPRQAAAHGVRS